MPWRITTPEGKQYDAIGFNSTLIETECGPKLGPVVNIVPSQSQHGPPTVIGGERPEPILIEATELAIEWVSDD